MIISVIKIKNAIKSAITCGRGRRQTSKLEEKQIPTNISPRNQDEWQENRDETQNRLLRIAGKPTISYICAFLIKISLWDKRKRK